MKNTNKRKTIEEKIMDIWFYTLMFGSLGLIFTIVIKELITSATKCL